MLVTSVLKSKMRNGRLTPIACIAFIVATSGCSTTKILPRPALDNLDSTSLAAREPADRYDPLVYCGGDGAFRCPPVTPKTEYVAPVVPAPVAIDPNLAMREAMSRLPVAPANLAGAGQGAIQDESFDNILFDFNQSAITPEGEKALVGHVSSLQGKKVELVGFTDSVGGERYNDALALRRARAVRDYLINAGLPAQNILVRGEGLCCYVSPNDSNGNRQLNRRVEIRVKAG